MILKTKFPDRNSEIRPECSDSGLICLPLDSDNEEGMLNYLSVFSAKLQTQSAPWATLWNSELKSLLA